MPSSEFPNLNYRQMSKEDRRLLCKKLVEKLVKDEIVKLLYRKRSTTIDSEDGEEIVIDHYHDWDPKLHSYHRKWFGCEQPRCGFTTTLGIKTVLKHMYRNCKRPWHWHKQHFKDLDYNLELLSVYSGCDWKKE